MKKKDIINKYNISYATLRNWKKLNYINDTENIDERRIKSIIRNKNNKRRNKKNSLDNIIPSSYVKDQNIIKIVKKILEIKSKYKVSVNEVLYISIENILKKFNKKMPEEVSSFFNIKNRNKDFENEFKKIKIKYNSKDDFLGCLYMSLLSVGKKDTNGIFYTPYSLVSEIIEKTEFNYNDKVLDPGCGSGNFLIQVYKKIKSTKTDPNDIIKNIYGYDIDEIAVILAKINLYVLDDKILYKNIKIKQKDFLNENNKRFNVIIGNPPWGKKYTKNEKNILKEKFGDEFSKEDSFSQFIIHSFSLLKKDGILFFVLPSSILNIKTHKNIRKFLLQYSISYIKNFGRHFKEIVTDVIVIKVNKKKPDKKLLYNDKPEDQDVFSNNPNYNFLIPSNISLDILGKIKKIKSFNLKNSSITYALGIVTGNNKKYIKDKKIKEYEPVILGKKISKYNINYDTINKYILFDKDNLQQVANENLYRNKNKIIYRFIGNKLTFAVEKNKMLSLNSANIIVFKNNDYDIYYICAILNSRITQLYFEEKYNTNKLLKSHIESFYIPKCNKDIQKKISMLCENAEPSLNYNENIENIIYSIFNLTKKEIKYLKDRFK